MKYFTHDLIARANGWIAQTEAETKKAERQFETAVKKYIAELETLRSRVSKPAWNFFRYGYADTGLHDARLLNFCIGDNFSIQTDDSELRRKRFTSARLEFLNYTEKYIHVFELREVKTSTSTIAADDWRYERNIGDVYTYELCKFDKDHLQIGFVFAEGSEISAVFRTLIYKRHIKPFKAYKLDKP